MLEQPKRLKPKQETLRELFLKSGNQCAFPGCNRIMINDEGVFVGQLCHIEAAEQGGERFNENQTNEERRAFGNLLLLCYEHHRITNDIERYPVSEMNRIKAEHEAKYTDAARKIQSTVVDHTKREEIALPTTLNNLRSVLNIKDYESGQILEDIRVIKEVAIRLQKLPRETRQFFVIMIERAHYNEVLLPEVAKACQMGTREVKEQLAILDRHGFISDVYLDERDNGVVDVLDLEPSGWSIWSDILKYSQQTKIPLERILVEIRFDLLD